MMKIIFIRHGEANNKTGKLTLRGARQVKAALKYLQNEKIDAIFCSPRTRALQTANILNEKLEVPLYIVKEFNERQLLTPAQALIHEKEFADNYLNYDFQTDKFETCKDFIDRTCLGLKNIQTKYTKYSTVVVAAHSSTLYAINAYVNGIPKDKQIKWFQCSNAAVIKFFA